MEQDENPTFIQSPEIPCAIPMDRGLFPGRKIRIQGALHYGVDAFWIKLQMGPHFEEEVNVAFYLIFVLSEEERAVRWTDLVDNEWGVEFRDAVNPLSEDVTFEIIISREGDALQVYIDGVQYCQFTPRLPPDQITHLVMGSAALGTVVTINNVSIEGEYTYQPLYEETPDVVLAPTQAIVEPIAPGAIATPLPLIIKDGNQAETINNDDPLTINEITSREVLNVTAMKQTIVTKEELKAEENDENQTEIVNNDNPLTITERTSREVLNVTAMKQTIVTKEELKAEENDENETETTNNDNPLTINETTSRDVLNVTAIKSKVVAKEDLIAEENQAGTAATDNTNKPQSPYFIKGAQKQEGEETSNHTSVDHLQPRTTGRPSSIMAPRSVRASSPEHHAHARLSTFRRLSDVSHDVENEDDALKRQRMSMRRSMQDESLEECDFSQQDVSHRTHSLSRQNMSRMSRLSRQSIAEPTGPIS